MAQQSTANPHPGKQHVDLAKSYLRVSSKLLETYITLGEELIAELKELKRKEEEP